MAEVDDGAVASSSPSWCIGCVAFVNALDDFELDLQGDCIQRRFIIIDLLEA